MLEPGVIADDLTGGVKVASLSEEEGVRCPVVTSGARDRLAHDALQGGYCHRAGTDPVSLVVKSGSAAEDDFIDIALERMRMADAASC